MESIYTGDDAVASLENLIPWLSLSPTFAAVSCVGDLVASSGPKEAVKFLSQLDREGEEEEEVGSWGDAFQRLNEKLRDSCGWEAPEHWVPGDETTEAAKWLKFIQLALVHGVHCEDRVAQIEAIRSKLPDHVQRELMNQISEVQREFFRSSENLSPEDVNTGSNPSSPLSLASLLGDSDQDLTVLISNLNNNNSFSINKRTSLIRELERLRDKAKDHEAEKSKLEGKNRDLKNKLSQSDERVIKLEYLVEELTEKCDQLEANNRSLRSQLETRIDWEREAQTLRDELDVLREVASRAEAAEAANAIYKEKIARMAAKEKEERKKMSVTEDSEKATAWLTQSVAAAREEADAYKRRATIAEDEVLRLRRKLDRLEDEKADWERDKDKLTQELRKLRVIASTAVSNRFPSATGKALLAEIEDYADDYEELVVVREKVEELKIMEGNEGDDELEEEDEEDEEEDATAATNRTQEDDGFCDYDLNTSESSAGNVPGDKGDSDYETCGNSTPKNGSVSYEKVPVVVATLDEAPRCVTVHHVKAEVYAPPEKIDELSDLELTSSDSPGIKLVVAGGAKFDLDPRETHHRHPKRPKRYATPPKTGTSARTVSAGPGPFWNRRRGPRPELVYMSDVSLSSEPSIYYQDIKLTDDDIDEKNKGIEEHEEECTALLVEEKPAAKKEEIIAAPDVVDAADAIDEDYYGNTRVSRRSRHEAEVLAKARAASTARSSVTRRSSRSKSKSSKGPKNKGVTALDVFTEIVSMCGP